MKAVAYSVNPGEKEFLAKANGKKHVITLISNSLGAETAAYASGKSVVIIGATDQVPASLLEVLAAGGIRHLLVRSDDTRNIDLKAAQLLGITVLGLQSQLTGVRGNQQAVPEFELARSIIASLDQFDQYELQYTKILG